MDSELRRRFLQLLGFDLAALDLREYRVRWPVGSGRTCAWPILGPDHWPRLRRWWCGR